MNSLKEALIDIEETAGCSSCAGCSYAPDYDDETFYCLLGIVLGILIMICSTVELSIRPIYFSCNTDKAAVLAAGLAVFKSSIIFLSV